MAAGSVPRASAVVARTVLYDRLSAAVGSGSVTLLSAPAGSGKSVLLRSWIAHAGLGVRAAWVAVERGERDAQRFWLAILDALRAAVGSEAFIEGRTPTPEFDGQALVERLVAELGSLEEPVVLVLNDLHELRADDALVPLELLLMRRPRALGIVLSTRHDLHLGLHRLRLTGELTEIRAADLRFSHDEARALLAASGVAPSDMALATLMERTEGWAAGLRLAALSLAGHPDPERFVAEFSGSDRTVAEYLLAEVLDRQPDEVRRLLLRTSILERVNGPLADLLTGESGGERTLHALADANAFAVAVDTERSWFRYHHLFADLLRLELRRTEPEAVAGLHRAAAGWFAAHGLVVEAIRHAQAAAEWEMAACLLADHWFGLRLDGKAATAHALLAAFPAEVVAADAELIALSASDTLNRGSLEEAERRLALATVQAASVPATRRGHFQGILTVVRLSIAWQRRELESVTTEAQRLLAPVEDQDNTLLSMGDEVRALALIRLGATEFWSLRIEDAERHVEQGVALARRVGQPYLELIGLAYRAQVASWRSFRLVEQWSRETIALARRHGWGDEPMAATAYDGLASACLWQGRLTEAEEWLADCERVLRAGGEPTAMASLLHSRGLIALVRGQHEGALDAFRASRGHAEPLLANRLIVRIQGYALQALVRLGEYEAVEHALAALDDEERATEVMRVVQAMLRLAQGDPQAATDTLAPVLDGSALSTHPRTWQTQALLLEAMARDARGDVDAAARAIERALDLVAPDAMVLPFLLHPAPALLERHRRQRTTHAALLGAILDLLAGAPLPPARGDASESYEELSEGERRVLRYLPSGLSTPEIAGELYLSLNTVKTHLRNIYAKLAVHRRIEAVERARALGLLDHSARR